MIDPDDDVGQRIASMCRIVERDEPQIGVFSMGERIAVALVLNRPDLLPKAFDELIPAIDRLGADWLAAAIRVHRAGWRNDE